jgi:exonuclease SbcC
MEGSHQRLAQQAEQITTSVNLLKQELSSLPGQERSLAEAEARARASAQAVSDLSSRLAVLEAKLQELEAKRQELTRSRQERAKAAEEAVLLRELGLAFGKDGVQALIIEAALPELERDANDLLGRIADGRMQVRFETQRPRKRPRGEDAAETLEIHIRDELGTRPYEMFSGGETFRLDFAIRITLSRLLVRRAGVPLQTLVIDEGFGSQDRQGREKLVEALNAIRSDFECLLVITHVEELKEMFPHHIFVTKDESGSRLFQD